MNDLVGRYRLEFVASGVDVIRALVASGHGSESWQRAARIWIAEVDQLAGAQTAAAASVERATDRGIAIDANTIAAESAHSARTAAKWAIVAGVAALVVTCPPKSGPRRS